LFIAVAYDIPDDRRRARLHKALKHFGNAVQYSVFECFLSPRGLANMKEMIVGVIDERVDQVRFYYLCEACSGRVEATIASRHGSDKAAIIV